MSNAKIIAFERIDDGEIFSVNENGTYSSRYMKEKWPKHLTHEYTRERLHALTYHFKPIYEGDSNER